MVNDYPVFIEKVRGKTGIDLSLYKEQQMKRRLISLSQKHNCSSLEAFYHEMERNSDLMSTFLAYMTINVTEFFRNRKQWEVLENAFLPDLLAGRSKCNVWSAACSTGEEPYSLGMLLSKYRTPASITILATDLDEMVISQANTGAYSERAVKVLTTEEKAAFFEQAEGHYLVTNKLRKMVTFKRHDLLADQYPRDLDLIVCRNVMIYFTVQAKHHVLTRFSRSLRKGGILFLGSTESLPDPERYGLKSVHSFFYQKV